MSAPPIRIESKAWTDSRYVTLALELGLSASEDDTALIRCAAIWRWQTEHYTDETPTYVVSAAVVNGCLKSLDGARALVAADLAEIEPDGRLRIRGGRDDKGKSRIDWLYRERERNREKGQRRAAAAGEPGARAAGRFTTSRAPAAHQPDEGCAPAGDQPATSSLISGLRSQDPDVSLSACAREPAGPVPTAPVVVPSGPLPATVPVAAPAASGHATLALELLNAARSSIDRAAQPVVWDMGFEYALAAHLRPLPGDRREAAIRHGVAAIAAAVRVGREPMESLRPGELAGPRSWGKWQAATVASIERSARGREGVRAPVPTTSNVPTAAETAAKMAAQREHDRKVAAEREATAAELARAKAELGIADAAEAHEACTELRERLKAQAGGQR